jgi:ubiquinone/menaquinone biosynthesis C-methylase UbiE
MRLPAQLIKFGFHLLYYQMAWSYDWVAWFVSFGQWVAWRRLALPFLSSGRTLELAFGTGGFFVDMIESGHQPVGIDLSPYMARLTRARLQYKGYPLRLNRAKAQALPFPSNYFDNVVATFPTDYMLQEETIAEVYRVLKSGSPPGRLVIVAEGELRGPWPIRPVIDWLYRVTDQRSLPPSQPLKLMAAKNFTARWEWITHNGIAARLLIGEKHN